MSDFASELAPESGRLRELPRLGAMVVLFQAGPLGSGLLATPFAGVPSREPILSTAGLAPCALARSRLPRRIVDRMTADPSMPASGRLPRVRSITLVGQLSGGARTWRPVLRGREDVMIRSIFAISELVKDTNDILPFK
ncbi:hypothetical protein BHM03_00011245 [Ensete ventricosum]|nr:hypothetical protein BHM03_00011245 [Ensete ventricosum]